jgi:hypothetical protein
MNDKELDRKLQTKPSEGFEQMSETNERVQEALAAYLEHLELGGPRPDTGHLSDSERANLEHLIDGLDLTQGVAFGLGRKPAQAETVGPTGRPTEAGKLLVEQLRESLPADIRIDSDPTGIVRTVGGVEILEAWIAGTFGGRIRVWLLAVDEALELESNDECLVDLRRVFGMFPDTTAVALVARDLSCLIVQPEDCAPKISIPSGSLVSRRYRQPIRPVGESVFALLNELAPYWDPVPPFDPDAQLTIDVPEVGRKFVEAAIDTQRGIGERARKGNPKKEALLGLGKKETSALVRLTQGLFDRSIEPGVVESRIERLAKKQ